MDNSMAENSLEPYKLGASAILFLFGGVIVSIITYYVIPSLIGVFTDITTTQNIGYEPSNLWTLLLMIFWGTIIIALPAYKAIQGKNRKRNRQTTRGLHMYRR